MKKPILKTVNGTMQLNEKEIKAKSQLLNTAVSQIEQAYGKGSIMRLGDNKQNTDIDVVSTGSIGLDIALGATIGLWGLPGQVAMIELFSIDDKRSRKWT